MKLDFKMIFLNKLEFYEAFKEHQFKFSNDSLMSIVNLIERNLDFNLFHPISSFLKNQIKSKFFSLKKVKKKMIGRAFEGMKRSKCLSCYSFKILNTEIDFYKMKQDEIKTEQSEFLFERIGSFREMNSDSMSSFETINNDSDQEIMNLLELKIKRIKLNCQQICQPFLDETQYNVLCDKLDDLSLDFMSLMRQKFSLLALK